jgi:hypothetical protein
MHYNILKIVMVTNIPVIFYKMPLPCRPTSVFRDYSAKYNYLSRSKEKSGTHKIILQTLWVYLIFLAAKLIY